MPVGGVRGPVAVSVFGEDRWPSVRRSFGLAGEVVFFAFVEYGNCDTFFFYRLCIKFSVSIFRYLQIHQPQLSIR